MAFKVSQIIPSAIHTQHVFPYPHFFYQPHKEPQVHLSDGALLCVQLLLIGKVSLIHLPTYLVDICVDILKLYIVGWFKGLSSSFLSVRAARLLVLAGTDRLDKELMIGQMQGKFQLVVVPDTGHMIHEVWNLHSLKLYYHEPYTKYRIIPRDWPRS